MIGLSARCIAAICDDDDYMPALPARHFLRRQIERIVHGGASFSPNSAHSSFEVVKATCERCVLTNLSIERKQSDRVVRISAANDAAKESISRFEFAFQLLRCRAAGINQESYRERLFPCRVRKR